MNIPVIYEDENILVVNKPAGLIVHFDGRNIETSVVDWFVARNPEVKGVGEEGISPQGVIIPRSGIVHRLDKTTSGVLILVKTQEAHAFIKKQFQDRAVDKKYVALVYGQLKENSGVIEAEIGRTKQKPRKWTAQFGKRGNLRAAITEWRVLERFIDPETKELVTYMEASPKTGRTHQIRVHFKAIHHPVVCDHIYAPKKLCLFGFERPALHAQSISFKLLNGENGIFEAPLPDDFEKALKMVR
jgi:23S rRNA pseudouridine1911/1915/1917 synthase|tara:strand:- start:1847 stop:2578 length:732 start_codon:yes stop_codon:yes gene_type:complete